MSEKLVSSLSVICGFMVSLTLLRQFSRTYFICDCMIVCRRLASAAWVSAYWNIYDNCSADS